DRQSLDTRIAAFEAEAARRPKQIDASHAALAEAKKTVETLRAKADTAKKDLRTKEKDLEVITAKRTKAEARLWEVKNNTEYSAVLAEIEAIKQEKAKAEEEILAIMELQERLAVDIRDAEAQLKRSEAEARQDEAVVRKKLEIGRASCRGRGEMWGVGEAEDGIRDDLVTGVQTCALPISSTPRCSPRSRRSSRRRRRPRRRSSPSWSSRSASPWTSATPRRSSSGARPRRGKTRRSSGRSSRRWSTSWPPCVVSASPARASCRSRSSLTTRRSSGRAAASPSPP